MHGLLLGLRNGQPREGAPAPARRTGGAYRAENVPPRRKLEFIHLCTDFQRYAPPFPRGWPGSRSQPGEPPSPRAGAHGKGGARVNRKWPYGPEGCGLIVQVRDGTGLWFHHSCIEPPKPSPTSGRKADCTPSGSASGSSSDRPGISRRSPGMGIPCQRRGRPTRGERGRVRWREGPGRPSGPSPSHRGTERAPGAAH